MDESTNMEAAGLDTAAEFLAFFEAIPDSHWTCGVYCLPDGRCCAEGLLGERPGPRPTPAAVHRLRRLFSRFLNTSPALVNDGKMATRWVEESLPQIGDRPYLVKGWHPKERICNALREIAEAQRYTVAA